MVWRSVDTRSARRRIIASERQSSGRRWASEPRVPRCEHDARDAVSPKHRSEGRPVARGSLREHFFARTRPHACSRLRNGHHDTCRVAVAAGIEATRRVEELRLLRRAFEDSSFPLDHATTTELVETSLHERPADVVRARHDQGANFGGHLATALLDQARHSSGVGADEPMMPPASSRSMRVRSQGDSRRTPSRAPRLRGASWRGWTALGRPVVAWGRVPFARGRAGGGIYS